VLRFALEVRPIPPAALTAMSGAQCERSGHGHERRPHERPARAGRLEVHGVDEGATVHHVGDCADPSDPGGGGQNS
jgi:hypothetical protein